MAIDFIQAISEREKREKEIKKAARHYDFTLPIIEFLYHVFSKKYYLAIYCKPERRPAILFSLKNELGLSHEEFLPLQRLIPGPIVWGSKEALTWLAEGLRAAEIPCRIHHARFVSATASEGLKPFAYPESHGLTIADAYADSRNSEYGNGMTHFSKDYQKRQEYWAGYRRGIDHALNHTCEAE